MREPPLEGKKLHNFPGEETTWEEMFQQAMARRVMNFLPQHPAISIRNTCLAGKMVRKNGMTPLLRLCNIGCWLANSDEKARSLARVIVSMLVPLLVLVQVPLARPLGPCAVQPYRGNAAGCAHRSQHDRREGY
jgi:hypothetical protein